MSFAMKYTVIPEYLPARTCRRSGRIMDRPVAFVVAHDTGCPNSTARGNISYYRRTCDDEKASAHIFVDDREILECIPALTCDPAVVEKAWHVLYNVTTDDQLFGCDANDAAIGVEYCYGCRIDDQEAYNRYVWVLAYICSVFGLDPATRIVGHCFLDPARRTDPVTGLSFSRRTYEGLLRDVAAEFNACTGLAVPPVPVTAMMGTATVSHRLNIRGGQPSTRAPIIATVSPGTLLAYQGWTDHGEAVNNNPLWYMDPQCNFFWSGGVR